MGKFPAAEKVNVKLLAVIILKYMKCYFTAVVRRALLTPFPPNHTYHAASHSLPKLPQKKNQKIKTHTKSSYDDKVLASNKRAHRNSKLAIRKLICDSRAIWMWAASDLHVRRKIKDNKHTHPPR